MISETPPVKGVRYTRLIWLLVPFLGLFLLAISPYRYLYKAIWYNYPDINDYTIFYNKEIKASTRPQPWSLSKNYNKKSISPKLSATLTKLKTVAFLIIKDDSITHEAYWDGYSAGSMSNSFSMAKSYIGALIGIAIQEGKIESLDQPVGDFLESFTSNGKEHITIRHLLQMTSGLDWDESYSGLFSITTRAYYDRDLQLLVDGLMPIKTPGTQFSYLSGDTQVLSFLLKKATGMSVAEYASKKLWAPMGCEHDALWCLDEKGGNEKAYCCINSNARDYARLGKLYLNNGKWEDKQLIPEWYVQQSLVPHNVFDNTGSPTNYYGLHWWIIPSYKGQKVFYARGILGQFMIVVPGLNTIIVRLGHMRSDKDPSQHHHTELYQMLDEVIE